MKTAAAGGAWTAAVSTMRDRLLRSQKRCAAAWLSVVNVYIWHNAHKQTGGGT